MTWNWSNGLTGTPAGLAVAVLASITIGVTWGLLIMTLIRHRKG